MMSNEKIARFNFWENAGGIDEIVEKISQEDDVIEVNGDIFICRNPDEPDMYVIFYGTIIHTLPLLACVDDRYDGVEKYKGENRHRYRPFTLDEIKKLLLEIFSLWLAVSKPWEDEAMVAGFID